MKNSLVLAVALCCAVLGYSPAHAQSTAFTYQGRLDDAGTPTSGLHDFRFRLFDAATGGAQIGSQLCTDNVDVVAGVFTAQLDFGQQYATTGQRHLEIEVRRDTGLTCGDATGFVVLSPRQPLTAAPMASHANSAFSLDAADGSPTNAVFVDNDGKVGVGTTSPAMLFHLQGTAPVMLLQDMASASNQAGYISFWNNVSAETAWLGYGSIGSSQFSIVNARTNGDLRLYTGTGGHINLTPGSGGDINLVPGSGGGVGVGTFTPTVALDVRGDVKLGPAGQYFAASADENLRTIRGTVNGNGTIGFGSGWTVARTAAGSYTIFFNTSFSDRPSVVASSSLSIRTAAVGTPVQGNVAIRLYNAAGVLTDDTFYFIATGPR